MPPAAENVPFWKKDISFGGGKKTANKAPKAKEPKGEGETKVPFWKKDISFGGGKKAPEAEEPTPVFPTAEPAVEPEAEPEAKSVLEEGPLVRWRRSRRRNRSRSARRRQAAEARKAKAPRIKVERGARAAASASSASRSARPSSQLHASRTTEVQSCISSRASPCTGHRGGRRLRDPDALTDALKDFFDKHKLPKRGVRLGIANNRIGVRTFDIVNIADAKQLDNAIRFRAQEALPIPIDEAVLDYPTAR